MTATDRDEAIRKLLPLVRMCALRFRGLAEIDDLISDGYLGLIHAVDAFDPSRDSPLKRYAWLCIAGSILNGARRMDAIPERHRAIYRHAEATRFELAVERGKMPSDAEVVKRNPKYERARDSVRRFSVLHIDDPGFNTSTLRTFVSDPQRIVDEFDDREALLAAIRRLPERWQYVLREHYWQHKSIHAIAGDLSISTQRASQIHTEALRRLRVAVAS